MRKHAVVFVDVERDQSPDRGDAVQGVEEEPLMFRERHHASIMEFENFSSVKAKTRRSTPVVIRSSTCSFTFSSPRPPTRPESSLRAVAPRLAATRTATLFTGANVSATRHAKIRREKLS